LAPAVNRPVARWPPPRPHEWGFPRLEPGATISFLCPRAPVPPLSKPESKSPQLSGDFWDTTLGNHGDFLCGFPAGRMSRLRNRPERTSLIECDREGHFRERVDRMEIDA